VIIVRGVRRVINLRLLKRQFFPLLFLLLAGCASQADFPDPLYREINQLKTKLLDIERKSSQIGSDVASLDKRSKALEEKVQENARQLQETNTRIAKLTDQQVQRPPVRRPEPQRSQGDTAPKPEETKVAIGPEDLYRTAYNHFIAQDYLNAISAFQKYVESYPQDQLADNAQYWIGESYYSQKNYRQALIEFQKVVDKFPTGNKVPDAVLKKGFAYSQLRESESALKEFKKVVEQFPQSEAAAIAKDNIQRLARTN